MVPINYKGNWVKSDDVWKYFGQKTRYVKVSMKTTYQELLDILNASCNLGVPHSAIGVSVWNCFPSKQIMPPYELCDDGDVVTFVEMNAHLAREHVTPLCITINSKEEVENNQTIEQPVKNTTSFVRLDPILRSPSPVGLDDINFTDGANGADDNDDDSDYIDDRYEDEDDYDVPDPFAYEPEIYPLPDLNEDREILSNAYSSTIPKRSFDFTGNHLDPSGANLPNFSDPSNKVIKKSSSHSQSQTSSNVHAYNDFVVGEKLKSKEEAIMRLRYLSLKYNRGFQVKKSDRSRFLATCVDENCSWRFRLKFSSGTWSVSKKSGDHTCLVDHRLKEVRGPATSLTIANMIKDEIITPQRIRDMLERVHGVKITYWKAWKAREMAKHMVRGLPEESYYSISSYFWLLEKENPGNELQWVAMGCNELQWVAMSCNGLQWVAMGCHELQRVAMSCNRMI